MVRCFVLALVIGLWSAGGALAGKKPKPTLCPAGRFLVAATGTSLLPGVSPAIDAIQVDGPTHVSLDGCGAATRAVVKATRLATKVKAKWSQCGPFAKVALSAKIASPGCTTMTGKLKARKTKAKTFTASRSSCGDQRVDGNGGEACDASAAGGDATCPGMCVACACTSVTTTVVGSTTTTTEGGCPLTGPGYGGTTTSQSISSVSAVVVDPAAAALAGVPALVSGVDLASSFATTDGGGNVTVSPHLSFKHPVFRFGDALSFVKLEIPLTMATTALGTVTTARLPMSGAAFQVGGAATSGGVTVTLASGTTVAIDTLTYSTADQQQFRAVSLPVAQESAVIGPSGLSLGILVGVAPAGTIFCPRASVTIPNTPGWPAQSAVEFYIQGTDAGEEWAPFGGWVKVSDGHVSDDGTTISTTPGQGFPILEAVFGVRLAGG